MAQSRKPRFELARRRRGPAARGHGARLLRRRARRPRRRHAGRSWAWSRSRPGRRPGSTRSSPTTRSRRTPARRSWSDLDGEPPAYLSPLRQPIAPDAEMPKRSLGALGALARAAARGARGGRRDGRLPRRAGAGRGAPGRRPPAGRSCSRWTATRRSPSSSARGGWPARPPPSCSWPWPASSSRSIASSSARGCSSEQMRQARAMTNLKSYADKIVASVPAGLLLLSEDLHVLSANRAFLESFRLREEDVLGRDLQQLVRAERLVRGAREVLAAGAAQQAGLYELYVYARRDTKPARITMSAHPPGRRRAAAPAPDRRGPHRGGAAAGGPPGVGAALPRPHPGPRRHRVGGRRAHPHLLLRQPPRRDRARLPGGALAARARLLGPPHPPGGPRRASCRSTAPRSRRRATTSSSTGRSRRTAARCGCATSSTWCATPERPAPPPCAASRWTSPSEALGARAARERGAAPAGAEDGRGGQARGRHRPRLQQPAHGHPRRQRPDAAPPGPRPLPAPQRGGHPRRRRPGGHPHAAAPRLQPQAGDGPAPRGPQQHRGQHPRHAPAAPRRDDQPRHRDRAATWAGSRPTPARWSR